MTAAVAQDLTDVEAGALVECERVIERGLNTFIEVGLALARIRDGRLYRSEYTTFDAYCDERWSLSARYAHNIIRSAEAARSIEHTGLPAPANEAQARELADVPEEQRADVWREARDRTYGRPTAAAIREVAEERQVPAPSTPDPVVMLRYSKVAGWIVGTPGGAPFATTGPDIPELDVTAAQAWAADETSTEHEREVIRWVESTERPDAWVAVLADDAPTTQSPARPDHEALSTSGVSAVATAGGPVPTAAVVSRTRPADASGMESAPNGSPAAAAAGAPAVHPSAGAPVTPEPYASLAAEFAGSACHHLDDIMCAACLADIAVRVLRDYLLDELADGDRYQDWYRANAEQLDELDEDMSHAAVVAHYLVDVVLPRREATDAQN